MEAFLPKDIADNRAIGKDIFGFSLCFDISIYSGKYGAEEIMKGKPPGTKVSVLTHCNTGSLVITPYSYSFIVYHSFLFVDMCVCVRLLQDMVII